MKTGINEGIEMNYGYLVNAVRNEICSYVKVILAIMI